MSEAPTDWDAVQINRQASFLQSSQWAAFQQSLGHTSHYLAEESWTCLLVERKTPLGKYLFAPYGPTLASEEVLSNAVDKIKAYAKSQGFDWISIEPMLAGDSRRLSEQLPGLGAKKSSHNREPDLTLAVDLTPPQDELLASISQSTRSFIRKNQRESFLSFRTSTDPVDVELFIRMLGTVSRRNRVNFFPEDYFKKQAAALMPAGMMYLELALDKDQPVASALFHDFGGVSSYTYAASLPEARQTSASALLLWQSMLNAKNRGMQTMDLFGVAPDGSPASHPWSGFTAFKKKFGGRVVEFAGTWDIPLTSKYNLYRSTQTARKILRRH